MSTLVADGKLGWDARVSSVLPSFTNKSDPVVGHRATMRDILSHRSGLSGLDLMVQGLDSELTLEENEVVGFANALPTKDDFRTMWSYCNFGYSIAARIIEQVSGQPWAECLENRILKPLNMSRTTTRREIHQEDSNIAKTYAVLTDGSPAEIPPPWLDGKHVNGAAGGVRSTVSDLLKWTHALMSDTHSPCVVDAEHGRDSPAHGYLNVLMPNFSSFSEILKAAAIIDADAPSEANYGLGIVRQSTPAALGPISPNRYFSSPVTGRENPAHRIFSHHGNFNGATCSLYMIPESLSAVVVLSNARGLSDATDWIAQDIIQTMFCLGSDFDVIAEARLCRSGFDKWFKEAITDKLDTGRLANWDGRNVSDYVGTYKLDGYEKFTIEIEKSEEDANEMVMFLNGIKGQMHVLSHYHYDVWEFAPPSYDEYLKRSYGPYESYIEFLLSFQRRNDGKVHALTWKVEGSDILYRKAA